MTRVKRRTAIHRVWTSIRAAGVHTSRRDGDLVTAVQAEIWHRRYPPASVMQALDTECGYPVRGDDRRVFIGLDILLRVRGWRFIRECSGPEVLAFSYGPAQAGFAHPGHGLEPAITVVVVLDRSYPHDVAAGCEVEILLAGAPHGHAYLTDLHGLTTHLDVLETHRPGTPVPVPFPIGRARAGQRAPRTGPGIPKLSGSAQ